MGPLGHYLDVDYAEDCLGDSYAYLEIMCGLLVAVWAVGLPLSLGASLFSKRKLIVQGDEDTLKMFKFVIGDFKQDCWYWVRKAIASKHHDSRNTVR